MTEPRPSRYAEVAAPPAWRDRLRCTWRFRQGDGRAPTLVLPDGCVDLIWNGRQLFVAGADRRANPADLAPGSVLTGVRLAAGAGSALLGLPLHRIADRRVPLDALWGARGRILQRRLEDGADPARTLQALCTGEAAPADRQMAWLFAQLADAGAPRVATLASALGISERSLRRRCHDAFGYGPKTLERVLRLQRFLRIARQHATLTAAALEAGYGDAAHLVDDARELTGLRPRELVLRHAR